MCYNDFAKWCEATIPSIYDDSLSYYEVVCKLLNLMKQQKKDLEELTLTVSDNKEMINGIQETIETINLTIATIEKQLEKYESGEYSEIYVKATYDWIVNHIDDIFEMISKFTHFIQFGLSANGHLVIKVPTNWQFIKWSTIMTPECPCWGHLVIKY